MIFKDHDLKIQWKIDFWTNQLFNEKSVLSSKRSIFIKLFYRINDFSTKTSMISTQNWYFQRFFWWVINLFEEKRFFTYVCMYVCLIPQTLNADAIHDSSTTAPPKRIKAEEWIYDLDLFVMFTCFAHVACFVETSVLWMKQSMFSTKYKFCNEKQHFQWKVDFPLENWFCIEI